MAKLSVAGKLVKEVSHNVPSSKFAIIELIKNAYEAGASKVSIEIIEDELIISDDGLGMSSEDIDALLVVSHSNKTFGDQVNGRLISGEKGLGFFSAFKFGDVIKVETNNCIQGLEFQLNMNEIVSSSNLNDLEIPVKTSLNNKEKGTRISISRLNQENIDLFRQVLEDERDYSKLLNAIRDDDFEISIKVDNISLNSNKSLSEISTAKLATATFNSSIKKNGKYFINLSRNEDNTSIEIDNKYIKLFEKDSFLLDINVNIYKFGGKLGIKDVPKLYHDKENKRIVPLVYINNSLFDNYSLYNTEINSSKKSSFIFRQQIGEIGIFLTAPEILNFNADRTQINESQTQILLKDFLDFFSSKIQTTLKQVLDEDKKKEKEENTSKDNDGSNINVEVSGNFQNSNDFTSHVGAPQEKKIDKGLNKQQGIGVKQITKEFLVLREYSFDEIFQVTDSTGGTKLKPQSGLIVEPQGVATIVSKQQILYFTSPCDNVTFCIDFEDKTTGSIQKIRGTGKSILFTESGNKSLIKQGLIYNLRFSERYISSDVLAFKEELNSLYKSNKYINSFVSGVRTFIELVVSDIMDNISEAKSDSLNNNYKKITSKKIIDQHFFELVDAREKRGLEGLYNNLKIKNKLDKLVDLLNLTSHNGSRLIGVSEIEDDIKVINFIYTYLCFVSDSNRDI